jgi:hypothetical protein
MANFNVSVDETAFKVTVLGDGTSVLLVSQGVQGPAGTTDHGALTGLADDDHTQYHNDSRANTWLATKTTTNLTEGTNLYYTDERAQYAVGSILVDSASVDFTYNDGVPSVTATVIQSGLDHGSIGGLADDDHTQYHNDTRADTWLGTKTTTNLAEGTNLYFTDARAKAAAVADAINNGTTDVAPSQNAVFDALALKQPLDTQLTDLAALSYTGNALKTIRVNAGENGFELTTGSGGITSINSQTGSAQSLAVGTSGTDFAVSSATDTHTFNLPTASATNRGALSSADWSTFNGKQAALGFTPEDVANKSTDGTLAANSTTLYPSQSAVKTYADAKVADAINNGTTTIAPSQNAVFDALELKADLSGDTFTGAVIPSVVTLTDAATIAVNAALGNQFTVTLAGNRTLGNPTGAVNGQLLLFAIRQDATGSRTLAYDTKFRFGTTISSITLTTTAAKTDYIGVRYHSSDDKFDVISVAKGY